MLSVHIIAVGKIKERYLTDGCAEYIKRLGAFCKLHVTEVDEYKLPDNPSQAQIDHCLQEEGKRIAARIPAGSFVTAMCIEGKELTSEQLSQRIQEVTLTGTSSIVFLIGGSYGLWQSLKDQSQMKLSMSRMTFPHQLARMLLLEQIYRAMMIASGGKYHK